MYSAVKKYLDSLGISQKKTMTHTNVAERLIRSMKKGIGDRILKKYDDTIHSSTGMKPTEAHKDDNRSI